MEFPLWCKIYSLQTIHKMTTKEDTQTHDRQASVGGWHEPCRPVLALGSRFLSYSWFNVYNNSIRVPFGHHLRFDSSDICDIPIPVTTTANNKGRVGQDAIHIWPIVVT